MLWPVVEKARREETRKARITSMSISSKYVFIVSMDVDADKEALFNEVYDTEHVPLLSKVPGVHGVTRMAGVPFSMNLGGQELKKEHLGPRYTAIYEIDGPHVLVSPEWAKAGEQGRWPKEVRPFTRNRHHAVCKIR
jgi:hypothetical protein